MRPLTFHAQALRKHLRRHKIATLPELKSALGTAADLTVFRKLKLLDYLSSYTHRGRYYALRETVRFDDAGLWCRKTAQSVPLVADASALPISPEELKAAILLFYSLLDEQQRRLFAGLESIKLGHGGDTIWCARDVCAALR
jgi:hypothetical protein